jgi:hypothetical protein
VSLRPLPGRRLRLEAPLEAWALSPGGSRLAAVSDRGSLLHLIDVERMRTLGRLRTRAGGAPAGVVWPRPGRLWIVLALPGCCAVGSTTVVVVDPIAERVVTRRRLAGGLVRIAGSPEGPVLLLAPPAMIGPARLVTVDAAGGVEELPLDGVSAGVMPPNVVSSVEHVRAPALAVDSRRRRAYVVSSRPHAVEIDLRRRRVSDHRLVAQASLLDRLRELLEPLLRPVPKSVLKWESCAEPRGLARDTSHSLATTPTPCGVRTEASKASAARPACTSSTRVTGAFAHSTSGPPASSPRQDCC